jgi:hypothetical protein
MLLTFVAVDCAAATLTAPAGKKARGWRTGRVREDTDTAEVLTAAGMAKALGPEEWRQHGFVC